MNDIQQARRDYMKRVIENFTKALHKDNDELVWAVMNNVAYTIDSYLEEEHDHFNTKA